MQANSSAQLNYVNGYPYVPCTLDRHLYPVDAKARADAAQYGVEELGPKFFGGSPPDLVVSGPNIGSELLPASWT